MAGEGEQVDRRRIQVDGNHARRLGRVDQEEGPGLADEGGDRLDRLHRPQHVGGVGHRDERRFRGERRPDRLGIDVSLGRSDPGQRDDPGLLERPQRPADRVVLQVGRDDVVAGLDHALDRQVQSVGAVVSEDPALGRLAAKELVEPMSRVVEHPLGRHGHPMPGPAGVGQAGSREAVEGLIDRLGLGEAGGGVVEVDHGSFQ